MKIRFLLVTVLLTLLSGSALYSAENGLAEASQTTATNEMSPAVKTDLENLVDRINTKLKADKNTEADLADNLKEFDALVEKHKDASPEDKSRILVKKAELYLQVLDEPEKALPIFKQIKQDYPTASINGDTDDVIAQLETAVDRKNSRATLLPGKPFPDFNETDVEGKPLSISKYKGKVVLVDFWATWCGPCVMELPQVQAAYDKYHDKGFDIVGVSLDENKGRLESFIKEKKMPWPQFFDGKKWENKLAVKYGVDVTPTGYLLDRDGRIIAKLASADNLETEVAKALKE